MRFRLDLNAPYEESGNEESVFVDCGAYRCIFVRIGARPSFMTLQPGQASEVNQELLPVEPQAWTADYRAKGQTYMFVDDFNHFRRPNAK